MLTVACVFSRGPKRSYDRSHVSRLEAMVAQYMTQPYRFMCLDDSPLPGWWAKIPLFELGRFEGRVLYLDLDVTIVGGLDDLADYPAPFVICKDWNRNGFNSSVMAWDAGVADHLYLDFDESVMQRLKGDQNWVEEAQPDAMHFPSDWCVSFKKARKTGQWPDDARVVCWHGFPKPWDVGDPRTLGAFRAA